MNQNAAAANATNTPVVVYSGAEDHHPLSSHLFAKYNAHLLAEAAGDFGADSLFIRTYLVPGDHEVPLGYLELHLVSQERECAVGIGFGRCEGEGLFQRQDFEAAAWHRNANDPACGQVIAASFDEAWRIVCLLIEKLKLTRVGVAYGI